MSEYNNKMLSTANTITWNVAWKAGLSMTSQIVGRHILAEKQSVAEVNQQSQTSVLDLTRGPRNAGERVAGEVSQRRGGGATLALAARYR